MNSAIIKDVKKEVENSKPSAKSVTGDLLLRKNITKIPKLIDPIFQSTGLAAVGGSSDVGKSTLLRQLAISVATNQKTFLGFPVNAKHNRAIYVSTEDDEYAISYLLKKYNEVAQYPNEDFSNLKFIFDVSNLLNELNHQLVAEPADLVIIDAFTDLFSGKLNEANRVRTFLNDYSQLAVEHDTLFIFLHHTGKRTDGEEPSKHNLLGSQAFEAKMRCVVELREDKTDARKRHLCIVKGNYLPKEEKTESYVLNFEELMFTATNERMHYSQLTTGAEKQDAKEQAKELRDQGYKQQEIAKKLGTSQSTVHRWLE